MRRKIEIAFRRKVRAVWLEKGMALAAQEVPWIAAKPALANDIAAENPGAETIRKVLEHIRRIWFEPPDDCRGLHSDALRLYRANSSPDVRFILNWGMAVAAYPFVGSVAEALGRLLRLQKEAHRIDVQRRLREQHGDRDFVDRITRYNISSFLDWGVIEEGKKSGVYHTSNQRRSKSPDHLAWLAEAVLISRGEAQMAFSQICHHPMLFSISVEAITTSILRTSHRLKVARLGLNDDFVSLEMTVSQSKQLSLSERLS
jgi:hypothetical protein